MRGGREGRWSHEDCRGTSTRYSPSKSRRNEELPLVLAYKVSHAIRLRFTRGQEASRRKGGYLPIPHSASASLRTRTFARKMGCIPSSCAVASVEVTLAAPPRSSFSGCFSVSSDRCLMSAGFIVAGRCGSTAGVGKEEWERGGSEDGWSCEDAGQHVLR